VLIRDWPALTILFVMPAILLIVITLTQESAFSKRKPGLKMILVNADQSALGDTIENDLTKAGYFSFTKFKSAKEAEKQVLAGNYQLAVIVPDSATEKFIGQLDNSTDTSIKSKIDFTGNLQGITFIYDPAVQTMFKDAVILPLKMVVQLSAIKIIMAQYVDNVNTSIQGQFSDFATNLTNKDFGSSMPEFPHKNEVARKFREELKNRIENRSKPELPVSPVFSSDIISISEHVAKNATSEFKPNLLQNNVPAFILFAMFFIVIPLAGSIINEKNQGTYSRLLTMPVSHFGILFAKIAVFIIVCIFQFIFLLCIGVYIMPMLGDLPSLDLHVSYPALLVVLLASSMAATGFGIVVGVFSGTHSQAATFGSVMVVILAMLGGIFVPAHMMPLVIRKISMCSPLRWGTDAFLGVFARNMGIGSIWWELFLLIGFFCISLIVSVRILNKRK
jgi:ABC-2 type transport system permease protein